MTTSDLRRRLVELDAAIIDRKSALAELERDRATVESQLYATSTFPVLTLPVEVVVEIFTMCLPTIEELREDERKISERLESTAPTVFLGVCRTWRHIALSTPALWTTLSLGFDNIGDTVAAETKIEGFVEWWLNRAGLGPLSIAFRTRRRGLLLSAAVPLTLSGGPFTPSRMRDVIHRYAPRVEYLELELPQEHMRHLRLDSAVFPLLRRATLEDSGFSPLYDFNNPVAVFTNAPHLRDLHVIHWATLSYYTPPSSQLTRFEGKIDDLALFTLAPNLTEARCATGAFDAPTSMIIIHRRLKSLALVKSYIGTNPVDIIQHLTLPALQCLYVSDTDPDDTTNLSLFPFLLRSSPPLHTLAARVNKDTASGMWEHCLPLLKTTLENLEVHSPSNDFHSIIWSSLDSFPRLHTLSFVDSAGVDYTALLRFLRETTRPSRLAKLQSFSLVCRPGAFLEDRVGSFYGTKYCLDEITTHLAMIANRGMDIHIAGADKTYVKHVRSTRVL
ncbi:hypothetical protein DFH07DRAFT_466440 [Mycena maculata]|uniref:F-box domain-containing protein n=1 Tax=Mycena maculata TaxID=230809 RepID=A0AAD7K800_9AGAR|nr:hypothetical protein DFH07DRAFT_466440 [Mycena maculata]